MGAAAGGHSRDRSHHHRQPGGHHRCFLAVRQGIHLGYLPRMQIQFTSETNTGQIFLPSVNTLLLVGVIALVWVSKARNRSPPPTVSR
jgi:hypothetical protein